jgi:hypothetical protein
MARKPTKKQSTDWTTIEDDDDFLTLEDFEEDEDTREFDLDDDGEEEDLDEEESSEEEEDEDDPRLAKLLGDNERLKREFQALQKKNKEKTERLKETNKKLTETRKSTRQKQIEELEQQKTTWRNAYKKAKESGDADQEVESWDAFNNASQRLQILKLQEEMDEPEEDTFDDDSEEEEVEDEQTTNDNAYAKLPTKARKWIAKNKWFNRDRKKTRWALAINDDLIEEGFDLNEDDFYEELENRLNEVFPVKEEKRTSRPSNPGTGRRKSKSRRNKVQITKSEMEIADELGISYEAYAQQKALSQRKGENSWTDVNFGKAGKFSHVMKR